VALFGFKTNTKKTVQKCKYQQLKRFKTVDYSICVSLYAKLLLILKYQIFVIFLSPDAQLGKRKNKEE
jgi:hypothetical protein